MNPFVYGTTYVDRTERRGSVCTGCGERLVKGDPKLEPTYTTCAKCRRKAAGQNGADKTRGRRRGR